MNDLGQGEVCPTCGEPPWSVDAGPCDGLPTEDCARQAERATEDEVDYLRGLEREVRLNG